MSRKAVVTALSAVVLSTLTACVTNNSAATCTVDGEKYLSADASASQICASFEERLGQALAAGGSDAPSTKGLAVAIELYKRGSAEARVTRQGDDGLTTYPVVTVDVMDRAFNQKDLDSLADAVARLLISKGAGRIRRAQ
jgi:hypothetical protein